MKLPENIPYISIATILAVILFSFILSVTGINLDVIKYIPKIPLAFAIDTGLDFLTDQLSVVTRAISDGIELGIDAFIDYIEFLPPWLVLLALFVIVWRIAGMRLAMFSTIGLLFIINLGLWDETISTIALVLMATLLAILFGAPLGIIAGLNDRFQQIVTPILDFMQTMPAFVYLIPAIPFFGLGPVAAVFATVVFAIPPAIRLTSLGIRQIDKELIEASDAFGATMSQKLIKLQIPLALPTIMAGINQTIMLSLSMVVIAAMIGAGGLGGAVWRAIQRLEPGMGFEAGIGVVIIAMVFDRVTRRIINKND